MNNITYPLLNIVIAIFNAMGKECKLPEYTSYQVEYIIHAILATNSATIQDIQWLRTYTQEKAIFKQPEYLSNATKHLILKLNLNPTLSVEYAKDFIQLVKENKDDLQAILERKEWVF